jgi:hypothetical protein
MNKRYNGNIRFLTDIELVRHKNSEYLVGVRYLLGYWSFLLFEINYFEVQGIRAKPRSTLSLNDSSRADALKAAKCGVNLAVKKQILTSLLPSGYGLWRLYVGSYVGLHQSVLS